MRITQNILNNNMLYNLQANTEKMNQYQTQLSTSKKINVPSDDPIGVGLVMQYNTQIDQNDQYQKNTSDSHDWLSNADTALDQAMQVMNRIRELAVQGANGVLSKDGFAAINQEVAQLADHLVQVGNTQFNGKYIFNGQMMDKAPYDAADPVGTSPDSTIAHDPRTTSVQHVVGEGISLPINVSGASVFGYSTDSDNAYQILKDLQTSLAAGNNAGVGSTISRIDDRLSKMLSSRSDIGARMNRTQLIQNRLSNDEVNLKSLLSNQQDANIAEVITNLKTAENVQQAALSVGARILPPTLVDFLK